MERPSLTDQESQDLLDYLVKRAEIMATLIPDVFDGLSAGDVATEVIVSFLEGKLMFDPTRGARLTTFLASVMEKRLKDHRRRHCRVVPWSPVLQERVEVDAWREHAASPPEIDALGLDGLSQTMSKHRVKLETLERCARVDPQARSLMTTALGYKRIPHNMDQEFAKDLGWTESLVRRVKNRIRYAYAVQTKTLRSEGGAL